MAFYVGQRVICVEDRPGIYTSPNAFVGAFDPDMDGLKSGAIYTVRAVGICEIWKKPAVWLSEIYREPYDGIEVGYSPKRFRPIVERKTDISIFKAMLNPASQREDA